ncbi:FG-GAP-like repeat-containing protein [Streptomyces orinoci]|uniref:FG-GAP-like repeat-containing protein n=1 Tax=Streptomyces orinoci TaxID=67339 RepID=A0ABV3K824_STRON|nr:FG-GAP-like repeat-containing protein [Streptomyces orinoci]
MSSRRTRAALAAGLLTASAAAAMMSTGTAHAVVGSTAKDGSYPFAAKLDIDTGNGGLRGCSAALVGPQWLVTAASCFAENPVQSTKVPAGAPKFRTTATIGRADLTRDTGTVVDVVELVPRDDRDLVLAKLAKPVTGIAPVKLGVNAPLIGEDIWVAGFGRTKDEWVPNNLHYAKFSVGTVQDGTIELAGKSDDAVVCQGDTGGPAFRDIGGSYELVAVNSRSWQGGCLGNESESRKGAVDTRVDDIADWVSKRVAPVAPKVPLGDYRVDINGDGKADYVTVDDNGSVHAYINKGGDGHGGWTDYGVIATGAPGGTPDRVRFADINGDGKADYLVVGDNGSVHAWINNGGDGHGGWKDAGVIATGITGVTPDQVRFADINGDGKADYLIVGKDGSIHAYINKGGDGHGGWTDYGVIATGAPGGTPDRVRFADINGDGKADYLVVGDNGSVHAWINNGGDGHGGWKDAGLIATGTAGVTPDQVRFADINGDGKADYLLVDDKGAVRAFLNKGGDGHGGWADYGKIATGAAAGYKVHM